MSEWQEITADRPPSLMVVETKIDDEHGERNVQTLRRGAGGGLWWFPDNSMYVYYTPTHWRPVKTAEQPK